MNERKPHERHRNTLGSYIASENKKVGAANGTKYTYRDLGGSEAPLVLLQHFRGNLENWDPPLIDALASSGGC